MKNKVLHTLVAIGALVTSAMAQTTHKISIVAGPAYSPSQLHINVGDTVVFPANGGHPLVEVTEQTFNAGGTTQKTDGFACQTNCKQVFPTAGTFYYACAFHSGLGMKGSIIVTPPTGLQTLELSSKVHLFPNPANAQVNIQFGTSTAVQSIELIDANGFKALQQVVAAPISSYQFSVAGLASGLYQVVVTTADKRLTGKLMVK